MPENNKEVFHLADQTYSDTLVIESAHEYKVHRPMVFSDITT